MEKKNYPKGVSVSILEVYEVKVEEFIPTKKELFAAEIKNSLAQPNGQIFGLVPSTNLLNKTIKSNQDADILYGRNSK